MVTGGVAGITLALDASTYEGSVAVLRGTEVVAEAAVAMRGEDVERLMPAVDRALASAEVGPRDVDRVVCGAGPGSFTSLRIAGAIAKGIAYARNVPLHQVSSLALVVAGAADLAPGQYLAVFDAMRGERYIASFARTADGGIVANGGGVTRIAADLVVAEAKRRGAVAIGPLETRKAAPHARGVASLLAGIVAAGPVDLDAWEPAYGRLAEAQVKWEQAHGRSLIP